MQTWNDFVSGAIPARARWFYLNQEIQEKAKTFGAGIYIYTNQDRYAKGRFKIGQTIRGEVRCFEQGGDASEDEAFYIVDFISSEKVRDDSKYDLRLHQLMEDRLGSIRVHAGAGSEWSEFPDMNPTVLVRKAIQLLENDTSAARIDVKLTEPQFEALDDALREFEAGKRTMIYELAPRFGKTIWALAVFQESSEQVLAVCSYVQTVFPSFEKEIVTFTQFKNMVALDSKDAEFDQKFNQAIADGKKIVALCSLVHSSKIFERHAKLAEFSNKIIVVDESDFGAHRENAVQVLNHLRSNNEKMILMTGTNGDRAVSQHSIDHYFGTTYFDMLVAKHSPCYNSTRDSTFEMAADMKSIPEVEFYQVDFSKSVAGFADEILTQKEIEKDFLPSWTKVLKNPGKAQGFITSFLMNLFNGQGDQEFINFSNMFQREPTGVMGFVPGSATNQSVNRFSKIAQAALPNWHVLTLTGEFSSGREAEEWVKKELKKANGKKLFIISAGLGSRSFSIPEIDTVLLLYDGGSSAATGQKMSRCLTRGSDVNKTGRVVSVSLDPTRDDKLDAAILETAAKTAKKIKSKNFNDAIKIVMRSLNIFMMNNETGECIPVDVDGYTARIMASRSLTRIIGKTVEIDRILQEPDLISALLGIEGEITGLGKSTTGAALGKTFIEGQKKNSGKKASQDDLKKILVQIQKAVTIIAENALFIAYIANREGFEESLNEIISNAELSRIFETELGIGIDLAIELVRKGIVNGDLFDLSIRLGKKERLRTAIEFWN